jgi:CheY-like chemotaxis protein
MSTSYPVVLYAEDEEGDRFFMRYAFERAGSAAFLQMVPNGEAAIQYLAGEGLFADRIRFPLPHILLLDLNMPKVSGFEVLQWIRQNPAHDSLSVVVFTASARDEDRARALALGATDYWEKPSSAVRYSQIVVSLFEKFSLPPAAPGPLSSATSTQAS